MKVLYTNIFGQATSKCFSRAPWFITYTDLEEQLLRHNIEAQQPHILDLRV